MLEKNIVLLIFGVWLTALTLVLLLFLNFFRKLTKNTTETDLKKVLEKILSTQSINSEEIANLVSRVSEIEAYDQFHVQKIGLVKFNPFKEIGGKHSFSLAILDGKDTGVIVTGLHTRVSTRIYAKAIKKGKSETELSEEEKKALVRIVRS